MGRFALSKLIDNENCFRCPDCKGDIIVHSAGDPSQLICKDCSTQYSVYNEIPVLLPKNQMSVKKDIQKFWGKLYDAAYRQKDSALNTETFSNQLEQLRQLFEHRQHLAVNEMPVEELAGKKVLEIGSGAGAHSALFAKHGAQMYSMDITHDRVVATAGKIDLLQDNNKNVCLQADAEKLPFPDNYFDIVYSNGVLHHSPDTPLTIKEAYRVLKPGGKAVIMLYARDSFYYWIVIFLLKGVLTGNIFKHKNWLGRVTEWMADEKQTMHNPETKVYSKSQIHKLFKEYKTVSIRKNSFNFEQVPVIGKIFARMIMKTTGVNQAGDLIYGHGWRNESKFELALGRCIGFALNITAGK